MLLLACPRDIGALRKSRGGPPVVGAVANRVINLTFHGIGTPERALDPGESEVWVTREQFLSLLDDVADRPDVRITFDDGNAGDVEHALPALRERGMRATFFVVAGRLGTPRFLDAAGVRELSAAGMQIGCHGMHHRAWRGLDDAALREELVDAKAILERVVGQPVTQAACPFGSYDRRVLRTLRGCGYRQVYTSDRGTARSSGFLQARNSVGPHDGPGLLGHIASLESPARRAKRTVKRWR
jgi:peptidoglycan/xylan/chitin deacetylase (PgdA/CDA1 family)